MRRSFNTTLNKAKPLAFVAGFGFLVALLMFSGSAHAQPFAPTATRSQTTEGSTTFREALLAQKAFLEEVRTVQRSSAYLTDGQVQEQYENLERSSLYQGANFRSSQLGLNTRIRLTFVNIMLFVTTSTAHMAGSSLLLLTILILWFNLHFKKG